MLQLGCRAERRAGLATVLERLHYLGNSGLWPESSGTALLSVVTLYENQHNCIPFAIFCSGSVGLLQYQGFRTLTPPAYGILCDRTTMMPRQEP